MNLVTGGTGLVGSHVILELLSRNQKVKALYRSDKKLQLTKAVFAYYNSEGLFDQVEWVKADLDDVDALEAVMKGCDTVYHTAAFVSMRKKDFDQMMEVNVGGTENVVNVALAVGVKNLCHVSSTAALGEVPSAQLIDEDAPHPRASESYAYSISKFNSERHVWRAMEEGLSAVIVNPAIIFGPSDWYTSSSSMFRALSKGMAYYPRGCNGFVDVRDVARAMVELVEKEKFGQRFLVTGHAVPFKTVFHMISEAFGNKPPSNELKPMHINMAVAFDKVRFLFTGKPPRVTKHSANASQKELVYSSRKLERELEFEFTPLSSTIDNATGFFKQYYLS